MPTNTSIQSSLVAGTVPPDQCPKTGQDIVNLVQNFMSVQTTSEDGTPSGPDNSIAEQALNTANTALAGVQSLQAAQKEVRTSERIALTSGNSNFTFNFGAPMPSTDYTVEITFFAGSTGFIAGNDGFSGRVLESSITETGFTVIFSNIPSNTKVQLRVVQR